MFQQGARFSEYGYHVNRFRGPVSGHETSQRGIAVGHLDGKGQVPDILEKTQGKRDLVIPDIPLTDHQGQHIESPHQGSR